METKREKVFIRIMQISPMGSMISMEFGLLGMKMAKKKLKLTMLMVVEMDGLQVGMKMGN